MTIYFGYLARETVSVTSVICHHNRADNTGGPGTRATPHPSPSQPHFFCVANRRKGNNEKRLSPRSKCYCFSHSRASRIQKKFFLRNHGGQLHFSVFHSSSTLNFISPTLDKLLANYFGA